MRIILIHGFNAGPNDHFHPWLAQQLRAKGHEVLVPDLPLVTGDEMRIPDLIEVMKDQIGYLGSDDILLGHSLGAFMILQYLEAVEMTETPRGVVLVAAPWKVTNPKLRHLFIADLDADVLMWKAREYVVVHSRDDKMVPFEHAEKLAERMKARLVAAEQDGHFMGTEHPVLFETVQALATTPFEYAPGMSLDDVYASER